MQTDISYGYVHKCMVGLGYDIKIVINFAIKVAAVKL